MGLDGAYSNIRIGGSLVVVLQNLTLINKNSILRTVNPLLRVQVILNMD
jgi:hypothetical protein